MISLSPRYITFGVSYNDVDKGLERLEDIISQAMVVLKPFSAWLLKVDKNYVSETADYLSCLINKKHTIIPVSSTPLYESIADSDWYFGNDTLELRNNESDDKKFATNYVLKDFPMFTTLVNGISC